MSQRQRNNHPGSARYANIIGPTPSMIEFSNRLLGDVPSASAILDRFLHHAQTIAITGRSYRLKDQVLVATKEVKKHQPKSNEPLTAGSAS
jgi:hypothetical protein